MIIITIIMTIMTIIIFIVIIKTKDFTERSF